ncbi:Nramp family divalent metal transporter [Candidatus Nitrosotalea okcheonensis]|uniref:Divalent metal cation transporter MntH n=1 Tax=Candidatus Nitrosotalea okcheonensis TaxID=1903276 RepID=A0A2H1FDA2_9ARCH|nr:Nramp family divalent metal transporter [Candidatus Nitrosotalea okcheonensis]SMH70748.1 Divalent metal cation transporter MntH [Candidatus Nitrosotalea okcheonensis]
MNKTSLADARNKIARFLAFAGPALIISIGYMDPGNYGTDITGGASYGYTLLWVVWLASIMAMLLQYLSGKIGIATEMSLPEIIRARLKKKIYIIPYWLSAEVVAASTDLAEYLGTVIALNLLFGVPLLYAAIFGAADVILILGLTSKRFRVLEQFFLLFVSVISFGFFYEIFLAKPDASMLVYHSIVPSVTNSQALFVAVGVIGATVMPHVLFLHSSLTRDKVSGSTIEQKTKFRKYHLTETIIVLSLAAAVNVSIMIMAAVAFNPTHPEINTISEAFKILIPLFGVSAATIFIITLLSSGIASSVVGTLAGQSIMEGLLGKKVNPWLRRLVTRFVNVIPTTIAILLGFDPLHILVYSQVILSILIPLPMIPLLILTRDRNLMGQFVNRKITTVVASMFVGIIMLLNIYLLATVGF